MDSCASMDSIEEEPLQQLPLLGRSARSQLLNRSTNGQDCKASVSNIATDEDPDEEESKSQ